MNDATGNGSGALSGAVGGSVAGRAMAGGQGAQRDLASRPARVAITGDFERLALECVPWDVLGDGVEVVAFHEPFGSVEATVAALRDFDAITLMHERIPLTCAMIEQLPRLRFIAFSGNRNEVLDDAAAAERDIVVCRSHPKFDVPRGEAGGKSPAELAIALLLGCTWQTAAATALIRTGGWAFQPGIPLRNKTLGVLGYGSIGRAVARVALALGMQVQAFSRSLTDELAGADNVARAGFDALLGSSDVISVHLPLSAATRGMIGARQIAQMKDGVIVINTARAPIIEEAPFLEALRSRKIAMAGLDVFWEEPLPVIHPLNALPNVVMTPHIGYATRDTMVIRYRGLLELLVAYRQGNIVGRYVSKPRG